MHLFLTQQTFDIFTSEEDISYLSILGGFKGVRGMKQTRLEFLRFTNYIFGFGIEQSEDFSDCSIDSFTLVSRAITDIDWVFKKYFLDLGLLICVQTHIAPSLAEKLNIPARKAKYIWNIKDLNTLSERKSKDMLFNDDKEIKKQIRKKYIKNPPSPFLRRLEKAYNGIQIDHSATDKVQALIRTGKPDLLEYQLNILQMRAERTLAFIENGYTGLNNDNSVGRIFSTFTSLPSAYRLGMLKSKNGKKLVEIDLKSSQPTWLINMVWDQIKASKVSRTKRERFEIKKEFRKLFKILDGDIYSYLVKMINLNYLKLNKESGKNSRLMLERGDVKLSFLTFINRTAEYSTPYYMDQLNSVENFFKKRFPIFYSEFLVLRATSHSIKKKRKYWKTKTVLTSHVGMYSGVLENFGKESKVISTKYETIGTRAMRNETQMMLKASKVLGKSSFILVHDAILLEENEIQGFLGSLNRVKSEFGYGRGLRVSRSEFIGGQIVKVDLSLPSESKTSKDKLQKPITSLATRKTPSKPKAPVAKPRHLENPSSHIGDCAVDIPDTIKKLHRQKVIRDIKLKELLREQELDPGNFRNADKARNGPEVLQYSLVNGSMTLQEPRYKPGRKPVEHGQPSLDWSFFT